MKRHILTGMAHPERGRIVRLEKPTIRTIRLWNVYIPDETHPLGGWVGDVLLHRRVNLYKDEVPRWHNPGLRPLYEFTKERPA